MRGKVNIVDVNFIIDCIKENYIRELIRNSQLFKIKT